MALSKPPPGMKWSTIGERPGERVVQVDQIHMLSTAGRDWEGKLRSAGAPKTVAELLDGTAFARAVEEHVLSVGSRVSHIQSEVGRGARPVAHGDEEMHHIGHSIIETIDLRSMREQAKKEEEKGENTKVEKVGAAAQRIITSVNSSAVTGNITGAPAPNSPAGVKAVYVRGDGAKPRPVPPSNAQILAVALANNNVAGPSRGLLSNNRPGFLRFFNTVLAAFRRPKRSTRPRPIAPYKLTNGLLWAPLPRGIVGCVTVHGFGSGIATHYLASTIGSGITDQQMLCFAVMRFNPFGPVSGDQYITYAYAVPASRFVRMGAAVKDVALSEGLVTIVNYIAQEFTMTWIDFRTQSAAIPELDLATRELRSKYPYIMGLMLSTQLVTEVPLFPSQERLQNRYTGTTAAHNNMPSMTIATYPQTPNNVVMGRPLDPGVIAAAQSTPIDMGGGGGDGDDNNNDSGDDNGDTNA